MQRAGGREGGSKIHQRARFHNIIMLYHNPLLVARKINARAGSYHSCCVDLMVTVNYSFPPIDLRLTLTKLTAQVD